MAVHFHPLKIKSVKKETADCVSVSFDVPSDLENVFSFSEGQNITIRQVLDGNEVRRSYSLCTAPHEKELKVAIKAVDGGVFSSFAQSLKKGDTLEILPPVGKFNAKLTKPAGKYLAIAAGSGITPVISIIKHSLQTDTESTFTLLYGNRSRNAIIFFEELEAIKNKYMDRFNFINVLSREKTDAAINYGRIDRAKLEALSAVIDYHHMDSIYLCGPEEMIFGASDFLRERGIDKSKIHFELFTTPGQTKLATSKKVETDKEDVGPKSNITVKLDGRSFDFDLGLHSMSILDAALQQGADLPYACKGGVCCTCRAKLVSGEVSMDVNYALEQEEVEAGFILTCQSHPRSEKVVVDFDVK